MLTQEENERFTRTGPGTAMGDYFRRFWLPVALSRELPVPDGVPLRVRLMGEDLLAFRDTNGKIGLIDPVCPHRGANLYFGRNEACGIRCIYHGWKFDVTGQCVDMPNVPAGAAYRDKSRDKMRIVAYPTREFGDIVWAYIGPAQHRPPEIPRLEYGLVPPSHRFVTKKLQQCNWAQSIEGALDTAHFSFLHMPAPGVARNENPHAPADERRLRWIREDPLPRFAFVDHAVGFVAGGQRDAGAGQAYWRISQFMLPNHSSTPSTLPGENHFGYTWVPITDESCWIYTYVWNPARPITAQELDKLQSGHGVVAEVGPDFVPLRRRENEYLIDREEQKHRTYTGIRGVAEQDAMVQDSQGYIADRTREHLTPTDAAIVRFRRALLSGAQQLREGREPSAARNAAAYRLRSGSWIGPDTVALEDVMRQRFGDPAGLIPD
jgi:phenylpropionate dioxygenase-like ring-hydroxylating dioxygenase large terminal subunit